jgi:hypothetical protein
VSTGPRRDIRASAQEAAVAPDHQALFQIASTGRSAGNDRAGKLADMVVIDGDPLRQPELLMDAQRICLVLQLGTGGSLTVPPSRYCSQPGLIAVP